MTRDILLFKNQIGSWPLRKKTLILVSSALLCLLTMFYVISRAVLLRSFSQLETADMREHVLRVREVVNAEFADLEAITGDWAPWTDSYEFVRGQLASYVEDNLSDSTFANLRINLMVFMNASDEVIYAKAYDLQAQTETAVSAELRARLLDSSQLLEHSAPNHSVSGILMLPESLLLLASHPIVTSDYQSPIGGTLIIGRYLNADLIAALAERTHLDFAVQRLDPARLPDHLQTVLPDQESIVVQPIDGDQISGTFMLPDLQGEPALLVTVNRQREIYQRGHRTLEYLLAAVAVTGLALSGGTLLLLEHFVLAPLTIITSSVWRIGQSADRSARVPVIRGQDELWQLVITINTMLESLQQSETKLEQNTLLLKEIHHRIKNNLQIVASMLSLEANRVTSKDVDVFLQESLNRIQSVALVHEKLYSSTQPSLIDLGDYTQSLVTHVKNTIGVSRTVQIKVNADPIALDIDQAVPVGLILNELITNCFKHAFSGRDQGNITVDLHKTAERQYQIRVQDDGVGFPKDFDPNQSPTLGLQLVAGLTRQLDGTIELSQNAGSTVVIQIGGCEPTGGSSPNGV